DMPELGRHFSGSFCNRISCRQRIGDVPDKDDLRMVGESDDLARRVATSEVAMRLKAYPDVVRCALGHGTQTRGDVVACFSARRTRLDLVGIVANEARTESGGEFSVS